ncbi:hypothetical protein KIW84_014870 [Lathyrus oleraceus]|uniref:Uncharacterized protein n=1 Tax=Pisum sativum TaxID=3888 RepID=A0A9D5BNR8_PEA|nr:hypothetical protein KIW84_014870 [Pisum sativum]
MGYQSITIANFEGITADFIMDLTSFTEKMANLSNQMNNANNNDNQQRDREGEHIRVLQGGNNHHVVIAENLSSKEEEPYEENIDVDRFFEVMGVPKNKKVEMVTIRMKSNVILWWYKLVVKRQRQGS